MRVSLPLTPAWIWTHTRIYSHSSELYLWRRKWLVFSRAENRSAVIYQCSLGASLHLPCLIFSVTHTHTYKHPADDSRVCNCKSTITPLTGIGRQAWVSCTKHLICTEILLKLWKVLHKKMEEPEEWVLKKKWYIILHFKKMEKLEGWVLKKKGNLQLWWVRGQVVSK